MAEDYESGQEADLGAYQPSREELLRTRPTDWVLRDYQDGALWIAQEYQSGRMSEQQARQQLAAARQRLVGARPELAQAIPDAATIPLGQAPAWANTQGYGSAFAGNQRQANDFLANEALSKALAGVPAAAPRQNGVVQENVLGAPTAGEIAGAAPGSAVRTALEAAAGRAAAAQPGFRPPAASVQPAGPVGPGGFRPPGATAGALNFRRLGLPASVDPGGSAGSIFGAYLGTLGAPQGLGAQGFRPPAPGQGPGRAGFAEGGLGAPGEFAAQVQPKKGKYRVLSSPSDPLPKEDTNPPVRQPKPGEIRQQTGADGSTITQEWRIDAYGDGSWVTVSTRAPQQGATQTPEQANAAQASANQANAAADRTRALQPHEIDQLIANIGLTNEQAARLKALLPGEVNLQNANVDQIRAAIDNAAGRLGLDKSRFDWDKAIQTAGLTGRLGDAATLDLIKTTGFDERGNPTLETRRFQHQQGIDYANSGRADLLANLQRERQGAEITGYDAFGNPTFAREQAVSSEERANLLAQASIGNQAAQIRLEELRQAEGARQFDANNQIAQGRLGLDTELGRGQLDLQRQQAERDFRRDPASVFDKVFATRGGFAPPAAAGDPGGAAAQGFSDRAGALGAPGGFAPPQAQGVQALGAPSALQGGGIAGAQSAPTGFTAPAQGAPEIFRPQATSAGGGGFRPPQQAQAAGGERGPLTYGEIQRSGAEPPGIAAATRGDAELPRYRPAGDMPVVSGQAYNRLTPTERTVFDAQLRATGNSSEDYHDYRRKLTGAAVRSGGGFSAPRRVAAAL